MFLRKKMPEQALTEDGNEHVKIIQEWLSKQPHLPTNIDEQFLKRFLHSCDFSLEKTKNLIDLCYTVRSQAPEIFTRRDPTSKQFQNVLSITDMLPLPKVTKDNYKLFIYRLSDPDPDKYIFVDVLKTFLAVADVRLVSDREFPDGEVPIFDMNGFSLRHLTKATLPILKKYMFYTQEAHPVRLKQIHVVNVPSYLDKVLAIVKPFMRSEVSAMIHFHLPNSTSLYQHIPKDLLPEEYGGHVGKLQDIKLEWTKKVMDYKDYLTDETRWRVDESKRPTENKNGKQLFGLKGSFRSLNID